MISTQTYYQRNRDKKIKYQREYRLKNKEKIAKQRAIKCICSCGKEIVKCHLLRHQKSKRHIKFIENIY